MAAAHQLRWGRILLGGMFIELTMVAIIVPVNAASERTAYYLVPVLALATAFIFGQWAARHSMASSCCTVFWWQSLRPSST